MKRYKGEVHLAASFYDNKGKLFVDCSECARTLCKNAWRTIPYSGGCYKGILHYKIDKKKVRSVCAKPIFIGGLICDLQ